MLDIYKELEEIRTRLNRVRATMELEADRPQSEYVASENMDSRERNARRSAIAESLASRPTVEPNFPGNARFRTDADEPMRLVLPLESFDEQIAAMTRRLLQAADTLSVHSLRVLGPQPCGNGEGVEELLRDRPSGALDRLAERLNELTGAVIYMEGEVNRATGLA